MGEPFDFRKRDRERRARQGYPEKIPPEKRGMVTCPECKGEGGVHKKGPGDINAVFFGCKRCRLHGEITPEEAAKPWPG